MQEALACKSDVVHPDDWLDLAGLLTPKERITALMQKVSKGAVKDLADLQNDLIQIQNFYADEERAFVCPTCADEYGAPTAKMDVDQVRELLQKWTAAAGSLAVLTLDDAGKEFAEFAQIGFGLGFGDDERQKDFAAVRGSAETNKVVQQLQQEKEQINRRTEKMPVSLERF